jgi:hypothetical protein
VADAYVSAALGLPPILVEIKFLGKKLSRTFHLRKVRDKIFCQKNTAVVFQYDGGTSIGMVTKKPKDYNGDDDFLSHG